MPAYRQIGLHTTIFWLIFVTLVMKQIHQRNVFEKDLARRTSREMEHYGNLTARIVPDTVMEKAMQAEVRAMKALYGEKTWVKWQRKTISKLPLGWNRYLRGVIPEMNEYEPHKPRREDLINVSYHPNLDWSIDNLKKIVIPFLPQYKSPCWFEEVVDIDGTYKPSPYITDRKYNVELIESLSFLMRGLLRQRMEEDGFGWRIRCLPYFYIAASPRSGTTDLFTVLCKHKDIIRTSIKEEIYWNRIRYRYNGGRRPEPLQTYLELNDLQSELIRLHSNNSSTSAVHNMVFGDMTPSYMFDFDAWRKLPPNLVLNQPRYVVADLIHTITPRAKIIFILRNPVDRALSDYNFFHKRGLRRSVAGFHNLAVKGINLLKKCFSKNSVSYCLHDEETNSAIEPVRLRAGVYEPLLTEWFRVFPRHQTFVAKFEDYAKDRRAMLMKVLRFLEMDDSLDERIYQRLRRGVSNQSTKRVYKRVDCMLNVTRQALNNFYTPWNQRLASLLHDDKFLWN